MVHHYRLFGRDPSLILNPGAVIQPVPGEWQPRMPERLDEEELADWRAGRDAVYQLVALTIGCLIGASILDPRGGEADDEPAAVDTRGEWSDAELKELGNMLVRGLSIEEIRRRLRRDLGEVRDKIVSVARG